MADLERLADTVIQGDVKACARLVQLGLDEGVSPLDLLHGGLMAGLTVVGERFACNDVYVPEVLVAARTMKAGMAVLRPRLAGAETKPVGTVVIGTVKGDLHDIGKGIVAMMLEGAGFAVIDLGNDVPPERFVEAVREAQASILGMSALLTTTMLNMQATLQALQAAGIRDRVRVLIGGAPVTQEFADQIGADGYAEHATLAVQKAKALLPVA